MNPITPWALLPALLLATAAQAAEYQQFNPAKSQVRFDYQQMGVAMQGSFKKFSGQLRFDPAAPAAAKASLEVELGSVDTGSSEGDDELATKTWFNTSAFPKARFESSSVKALGGARYEVAGKLTIKGVSRDVVVPAAFTNQGKNGQFDGQFTIKRGDFSIGEGAWKAFDVVANDVVVHFRIAATAP